MDEKGYKPEFDTTNPEWSTDFGPAVSKTKRYVLAGICVALILGFLGVAIFLGQSTPSALPQAGAGKVETGIPVWVLFIPFAILLICVTLFAEKFALWVQRKLNWKPDLD